MALSVCPSVCVCFIVSVSPSVCPVVRSSVCLFDCPSVRLSHFLEWSLNDWDGLYCKDVLWKTKQNQNRKRESSLFTLYIVWSVTRKCSDGIERYGVKLHSLFTCPRISFFFNWNFSIYVTQTCVASFVTISSFFRLRAAYHTLFKFWATGENHRTKSIPEIRVKMNVQSRDKFSRFCPIFC